MAKAIVHEAHTQIFPTNDEVKVLCKPGAGADTCILLTMGCDGWECHGLNRQPIWSVIERARRGETGAQREGCKEVEDINTFALGEGEHELQLT